jgi:LPS-assembly lipoprotein
LYRFGIFFLLLLLSGCGFQLRGATTVPMELSRTYIDTSDRRTLFYRELRDVLRKSGVEVVDDPADSTAIFNINSDETGQRVLSVSARNVPREFEVFYTVVYGVVTTDKVIMSPRRQTLTRDYIWDETLVLGKEKEEQLLREAIVHDLTRNVLIQLSAL